MLYLKRTHIPADIFEEIVALGEGYKTEFRERLPSPLEAARTLCAFANTKGGNLFIGVDRSGGAGGVTDPYAELESLEQALDLLVPRPELTVSRAEVQDADILQIEVPEGVEKPYFVQERDQRTAYVRTESGNAPAGRRLIRLMERGRSRP